MATAASCTCTSDLVTDRATKHIMAEEQDGVSKFVREASPTHYTVKFQSFSLLSKNSIDKYDSGDFEACGYKWKLRIYPNGNKSRNGKDHISLYLVMSDTTSLPLGWEVNAVIRFFLLDQISDNYLTLQDTKGMGRRFHAMKTEWGFDQFIPLKSFNEASNGYLVDDACVFGAEVFVSNERSTGKGECLSMIKELFPYKHIWRIENFSKIDMECYESKPFSGGDQKWKVQLYRKGKSVGTGSNISLYLALADPATLPPSRKIYVEFTLRLLDQMYAKHQYGKVTRWFSASNQEFGWARFIPHTSFYQENLRFLLKDTCIVEAEITVLGVTSNLSET